MRHMLPRYTNSIRGVAMALLTTTVFINNRTQAVRPPTDMRLPAHTKHVLIRARGQERIISPAGQGWDSFFIDGPMPSDDFLSERASQSQAERESL